MGCYKTATTGRANQHYNIRPLISIDIFKQHMFDESISSLQQSRNKKRGFIGWLCRAIQSHTETTK